MSKLLSLLKKLGFIEKILQFIIPPKVRNFLNKGWVQSVFMVLGLLAGEAVKGAFNDVDPKAAEYAGMLMQALALVQRIAANEHKPEDAAPPKPEPKFGPDKVTADQSDKMPNSDQT